MDTVFKIECDRTNGRYSNEEYQVRMSDGGGVPELWINGDKVKIASMIRLWRVLNFYITTGTKTDENSQPSANP